MFYHGFWLLYDVAHLGRPWALFFIAMSVWAIVRLARRRGGRGKGGWWL